jgi:hypothetical protein
VKHVGTQNASSGCPGGPLAGPAHARVLLSADQAMGGLESARGAYAVDGVQARLDLFDTRRRLTVRRTLKGERRMASAGLQLCPLPQVHEWWRVGLGGQCSLRAAPGLTPAFSDVSADGFASADARSATPRAPSPSPVRQRRAHGASWVLPRERGPINPVPTNPACALQGVRPCDEMAGPASRMGDTRRQADRPLPACLPVLAKRGCWRSQCATSRIPPTRLSAARQRRASNALRLPPQARPTGRALNASTTGTIQPAPRRSHLRPATSAHPPRAPHPFHHSSHGRPARSWAVRANRRPGPFAGFTHRRLCTPSEHTPAGRGGGFSPPACVHNPCATGALV